MAVSVIASSFQADASSPFSITFTIPGTIAPGDTIFIGTAAAHGTLGNITFTLPAAITWTDINRATNPLGSYVYETHLKWGTVPDCTVVGSTITVEIGGTADSIDNLTASMVIFSEVGAAVDSGSTAVSSFSPTTSQTSSAPATATSGLVVDLWSHMGQSTTIDLNTYSVGTEVGEIDGGNSFPAHHSLTWFLASSASDPARTDVVTNGGFFVVDHVLTFTFDVGSARDPVCSSTAGWRVGCIAIGPTPGISS